MNNAVPAGLGTRTRALLELFKLRMTLHILVTTLVGFWLASPPDIAWGTLAWTLLGTGLFAASAFSFNQAIEGKRDALMERTQRRPVPSRRITPEAAWIAGVVVGLAGTWVLWTQVNGLTAFLGALTVVLYAAVYTPLKPVTTFNTLVGGIPGALPPLMGWTAAQNAIGMGGILLFVLLFFWQLPHFLALAWMYKDDYARGGYRMLSLVDDDGAACFRQVVLQSVLLLPVSAFPYVYGLTGGWYLVVALAAGLVLLALALRLRRLGTRRAAVHVFLWSLAYLPLVLLAMAFDKQLLFVG